METANVYTRRDEPGEFNLKLALVEVLRNIKKVLIFALVFAVVLGFAKWRGDLSDRDKLLREQEVIAQEGFDSNLSPEELETQRIERETYRAQKASYEAQISAAQAQITQMEAQKGGSVLLSAELDDFRQRGGIWFVDTHYQIHTDTVVQESDFVSSILSAYETLLSSGEFYDYVGQHMTEAISNQYLSELITITRSSANVSAVQGTTGHGAATISVSVFGSSDQMAGEIYGAAKAYLTSHSAQVARTVHAHDLTLVDEWEGSVAGEQADLIRTAQDSYNGELAALRATVSDLQAKLLTLKVPSSMQAVAIERALKSDSEIAVNAVIFGLLGMLVGAVLAAVIVIIAFVKRDAALDESEIQQRCGVLVLSSLRRFSGTSSWQQSLSRLCGDEKRAETLEEVAALARVNLCSALEAAGRAGEKVLLIGQNEVNDLARLIGRESSVDIVAGGNVMLDATAAEAMRSIDNVALVERKEGISYREINTELDRLAFLKKNVVGMIAL